ncbi:MAG: hypothetical protein N7Q72_03670, partial [Spiroplasma sp. Tabriz.8]|nr:hypothetical protein [Spiroplasma sp. Tabriz.8]
WVKRSSGIQMLNVCWVKNVQISRVQRLALIVNVALYIYIYIYIELIKEVILQWAGDNYKINSLIF